jgi:DNA-binding LytR/AlgR family response regulator
VTAYDDFAVDAFGVDAVDYLLKPVRLQRLRKAVERARRRLAARARDGDVGTRPQGPADDEESTPLERISVEDNGSYRVVDIEDILFFESLDGDVFVRTPEARYKTDFRLKFLESNLPEDHFYRCHRSFIVRLDAIRSIEPAGAGTYRLHLGDDGQAEEADVIDPDSRAEASSSSKPAAMHVPLARARASEFKRRIPWSANVVD